jgi:hypothetical protein
MPDFSTDRIVTFKSQKQLLDALSEKSKHGGGALRGISTTDVKGGNAINIAYCLAKGLRSSYLQLQMKLDLQRFTGFSQN